MKVFISWSGDLSHKVALVWKRWLPSVIQAVVPYVSSEDIDKGARWSTDISRELEESTFGIVCVTKDNLDAPWVNFEAGALSKTLEKSRVAPFLFGVKRSEVQGPLLQFQSTVYEKDDIIKMLKAINSSCDEQALEEPSLEEIYEVWWPQLEERLGEVAESPRGIRDEEAPKQEKSSENDVLEEILNLVRNQQKLLSDPEALLPPEYIYRTVNSRSYFAKLPPRVWEDLIRGWRRIKMKLIDENDETSKIAPSLMREIERVDRAIYYMGRKQGIYRAGLGLGGAKAKELIKE